MHELTVQTVFSAAHAIVIRGQREPLHGHDWHVKAAVGGDTLDADGLLLDFHALETELARIVAPFRSVNLNEVAPFDRLNPTAEHVAAHIGAALQHALARPLDADAKARGVRLLWASVTEAPGCLATWRPDPARPG